MKRLEIDLNKIIGKSKLDIRIFVESELKKAGFDRTKEITSIVDADSMTYTYLQE